MLLAVVTQLTACHAVALDPGVPLPGSARGEIGSPVNVSGTDCPDTLRVPLATEVEAGCLETPTPQIAEPETTTRWIWITFVPVVVVLTVLLLAS